MPEEKSVPALSRGILVIDLVCRNSSPIRLSEIARLLELPKSTVHALCHTLVQHGVLRELDNGFVPGSRPVMWAESYVSSVDIAAEFKSLLAGRPELDEYTFTLSVLEGADVVYLSSRNSSAPLGISFRPGMRLPAAFAATGKAMLSAGAGRDILLGPLPAPLTQRSVKSLKALKAQLDETSERGFSIDRGEVREGMVSLGAAVLGRSGKPIAGIAMSMTEAEARDETVIRLGCLIANLAGALSEGIGPIED